jgi:cytochrome P450
VGEGTVASVGGFPLIRDYAEVKAAAKDWTTFSSDLQGDRDVRTYRQLPLEVDPPLHRAYRDLLAPTFGRAPVAALEPEIRDICRPLVTEFARSGRIEAVHGLALPIVTTSLAVAFGRPQDADEYRSWGLATWITLPDGTRTGSHLDAYLERVFAEVSDRPGEDVFSAICSGAIDDRPLTTLQMLGVGNLILAGGRDTVISLIAGALWYLALNARDRRYLAADPARIPSAVEELLRYFSPLPSMERVVARDVEGSWGAAKAGDFVRLGFGEANHDRAVFGDPGNVRLDRRPNPHLAFGNGPHTCIGVHLARLETRVLLEEMLVAVPDWRLAEGADIEFIQLGGTDMPSRFDALPIEVGT